jgi:hypothetical protein
MFRHSESKLQMAKALQHDQAALIARNRPPAPQTMNPFLTPLDQAMQMQ